MCGTLHFKLESYSCKHHCFGHSPFSIVLK
uniref:Uncharacterized protein n=1 Tax=Anguilla anguilla TaxID=7936 RepID=A0A0E9S2W9_ANGAN